MTQEEVNQYWKPARMGLDIHDKEGFGSSKMLAAIVGIPYPYPEYCMVIPLTPGLKKKLELLATPHRQTIIKMLEARKGLECESTKTKTEINRDNLQETG
jgi:hypothetical protein